MGANLPGARRSDRQLLHRHLPESFELFEVSPQQSGLARKRASTRATRKPGILRRRLRDWWQPSTTSVATAQCNTDYKLKAKAFQPCQPTNNPTASLNHKEIVNTELPAWSGRFCTAPMRFCRISGNSRPKACEAMRFMYRFLGFIGLIGFIGFIDFQGL